MKGASRLRVVLDTDVIAAVLLAQPARSAPGASLIARADELLAPSHVKAELGNVIWKSVVFGDLPAAAASELITLADRLPLTLVDVGELWRGAIASAIAARQPVYDMLFVELAIREGVAMASYDRALQKKFPTVVMPPEAVQ